MNRAHLLVYAAALGATLVFFINVCDLVFDCGCRSLWNGAAADCNIHREAPPHCPWCAHPLAGGGTAFLAAALAEWAIVFGSMGGLGLLWRALLALAAFPLASGLAGWLAGLFFGYWV